jgi:hypothetical protein
MKGAAVTIVTGTPVSGTSDQITDLELHHRRRARCEDRIRTARDTSLRNLPLHDSAQNQIWLEIVSLALASDTRRWEPKKFRFRLFSIAAQLVNTGRRG